MKDGYIIISSYVDDMLVFSTNLEVINTTKNFFSSKFDMKDMSKINEIVGVKMTKLEDKILTKLENRIFLLQEYYTKKILKKKRIFW